MPGLFCDCATQNRFGDYWRLGLPLEVLVVAVSIPLLLIVWPL
jgi:di/tricarboxylate transporter